MFSEGIKKPIIMKCNKRLLCVDNFLSVNLECDKSYLIVQKGSKFKIQKGSTIKIQNSFTIKIQISPTIKIQNSSTIKLQNSSTLQIQKSPDFTYILI